MLEQIVIHRYVNFFYYFCFLVYTILFLIYIIPKRKNQPYKNSFRVFLLTSIVLTAMEFFGTLTGIRVFNINGQTNLGIQLTLQLIMGLGEGGTATAIIYLMIEALYDKKIKNYFLYLTSLAVLMLIFAIFTYLYKIMD